mgnify:CR=1 FL=1
MQKVSCHIALFRNNNQEILLTLRSDFPIWVLPAGQAKANETIEDVVIREVLEETGLNIRPNKTVAIYESPDKQIKKVLLRGDILSGEMSLSNETRDIKWFDVNKLPFSMLRFEAMRIKDALSDNKEVLQKEFKINMAEELGYFSKSPFTFLNVLISYTFSRLHKLLS